MGRHLDLAGRGNRGTNPADHRHQLGHRVLGGHRIIEQCRVQRPTGFALQHSGLRDHLADRVEDPLRPVRVPELVAPQRQHRGMEPLVTQRQPAATFQRRSVRNATSVSRSDSPSSDCNNITVATTSAGTDGRPCRAGKNRRTTRRETAADDARPTTHTPPLRHEMANQRRRIKQLRITITVALHTRGLHHQNQNREHRPQDYSAVS